MSGYFEIGIHQTKYARNVGVLWRTAWQLGASGIFTIGCRYDHRTKSDCYDTSNNIPLRHYESFAEFFTNLPIHAVLVGVEQGGQPLSEFVHPRNAVYLLGAEDAGLPGEILTQCRQIISLQAVRQAAYNVAVAGSIVMYHRAYWQDVHRSFIGRSLHIDRQIPWNTEESDRQTGVPEPAHIYRIHGEYAPD